MARRPGAGSPTRSVMMDSLLTRTLQGSWGRAGEDDYLVSRARSSPLLQFERTPAYQLCS